jgi:cytochrome P450
MIEQVALLADSAYIADPYATWARMRAETPVYQDVDGRWYLTRYEDCVAALKDLAQP